MVAGENAEMLPILGVFDCLVGTSRNQNFLHVATGILNASQKKINGMTKGPHFDLQVSGPPHCMRGAPPVLTTSNF